MMSSVICTLIILLVCGFNLLISHAEIAEVERMTSDECKEAGYNNLKTSTCKLLLEFQLDELYTACVKCSSDDTEEIHEKYPFAEMQVCDCNLYRFPQVSAFVKGDMKNQWGNQLNIRQVRGSLPTIVLKNEDGQVQKSLNIEKWDTDTITEFLNDWLD